VEQVDTTALFGWIEGWLVFDDTPLRDALPQLSRWYDLDFRLADSALGKLPLSGTFKEQLADDGLDALAASLGLRQVRHSRVVTLYGADARR
jgi:transmembrane sensor